MEQWHHLQQANMQGRLPHALLLSGPTGLGKELFALSFAQSCLCPDKDNAGYPCGICRHCQLMSSFNHPDFQWIRPYEGSKSGEIKVEAIRSLTAGASLTSYSGGSKVIIIQPAHRMNNAAANSLLKTLEEPTPGTVILLLTDQPTRLLPTIRSRCQKVVFHFPGKQQSISWLAEKVVHAESGILLSLANGAPLKALKLDSAELLQTSEAMLRGFLGLAGENRNPVSLARQWTSFDRGLLLEWLAGWVIDLIRLKEGGNSVLLFNQDHSQALQNTADKLSSSVLQGYLLQIYQAKSLLDSNLNPQLTLEKLLIDWHTCFVQAA
ncbi:MAG: DNA polymerase III subunit delta' [Candidatus Thiodiazotropha sp. (ex Lucinoma aequizonata)]|nr:DNA polymerase III subunit delta' [Candidatus Thiodiazotropha sp. (ex Lucinoma aequizonata)]MCU7888194.1 DNA polymerase III subunit delta' [Candidatus Thiodiazotropha sp. (ex Lucinoma aequizonata)]MCU7897069.1 DNA polymerase III subunit delta' [Candidatus Thiodiazotropha sp. (ex Lucinoma aequizonata)]MCU7900222.1 DNA polymerase III subunit delta' [Candidatus Thiodiazotropha sp. (ex Lucinoma aequizonata)]MCU7901351.1 DNA polymerase III subunit delta' [Candidatus Thiodiazotropha sp. (ex Lucino